MTVMPNPAAPGELSARVKAVSRSAGTVKVHVTKSRSVPVKLGRSKKGATPAARKAGAGKS